MSPEHTDKILSAAKEQFGVVTGELRDRIREAAAGVLEETQDEGKGDSQFIDKEAELDFGGGIEL